MSARDEYLEPEVAQRYESVRFSGRLGQVRWRAEQRGVASALAVVGNVRSVLDVPTGIGRWIPMLHQMCDPDVIVGADYSPAMLAAAVGRGHLPPWRLVRADATALPHPDRSFDLVFSHALTKHLPADQQALVLGEFARVCREYVVCSFSLLDGFPGAVRRLRRARGAVAIKPSWLREVSQAAGLQRVAGFRCTTIIGVEHSIVFRRIER